MSSTTPRIIVTIGSIGVLVDSIGVTVVPAPVTIRRRITGSG
jgi:hypothetical protein